MLLDGRGTARDLAAVQALVDSGLARADAAEMLRLAALLLSSHSSADAEPLVQRIMQHPASASARSELAFIKSVGLVGQAYLEVKRLDAAQSWLGEQVSLLEKMPAPDGAVMAEALQQLGGVHALKRQGALAGEAFARSVALRRGTGGAAEGSLAQHYANIASAYLQGDYFLKAEHYRRLAMRLYEEAGQGDSPAAIENAGSLGLNLHSLGRYHEAAALLTQLTDRVAAIHGKSSSWYWYYLLHLGESQLALGQTNAAKASFRSVLAMSNGGPMKAGPNHIRALALLALGVLEARLQNYDDAQAWLRKALAIHAPLAAEGNFSAALIMMELGKLLTETGRAQQAEVYLAQALDIMRGIPSAVGSNAAEVLDAMGRNQARQAKYALAVEHFERALAVRIAVLPAHHGTRETAAALAAAYRSLGREEAAQELEKRMVAAGPAVAHAPGGGR